MRKTNNLIEINGGLYDATTGAALVRSPSSQAKAKPVAADVISPPLAKPLSRDAIRQAAKHSPPHPPKPASTLMRRAVKKPGPSLKRQLRAQGYIDALAQQPLDTITVNSAVERLDTERLQHAKQVAKSQLVSHFSAAEAINVSQAPSSSQPPQPQAVVPSPQVAAVHDTAKTPRAISPGKRPKTTADLLERAVQQATGYREIPPSRTRHNRAKRNASIGAAGVLSVALLAVVVMQNLPKVRLQMASAKAGFSASLPGYRPAGYSLGQLNYSDGVVATQFHTSGGDHAYTITQKRSSWDNLTLRDSFVAQVDANYKTIEAGGRTIYLYGDRNATWVNGGIWYIIQANGSLSDPQLVDLATSL